MSHECHESEYSKFLKSLGIDKEKMLADMESRLPEDERNRLRKMRLERIEELEKENAELKETVTKMNNVIIETFSNLAKAKGILQTVLDKWKKNRWLLQSDEEVQKIENLMEQAEQFLQED